MATNADTIEALRRDLDAAMLLLEGIADRLATAAASMPSVRARTNKVWTTARRAVLERDYPSGVPFAVMLDRLNRLPGKELTRRRISLEANRMKLYRPPSEKRLFALKGAEKSKIHRAILQQEMLTARKQSLRASVQAPQPLMDIPMRNVEDGPFSMLGGRIR